MAFIAFQEGRVFIGSNGLPNPSWFLLSTKAVAEHSPDETLAAANLGEIPAAAVGYVRKSQPEPVPIAGVFTYSAMVWNCGGANWPNAVKSVVMASSQDNSGKAICAWDLGAIRDLSQQGTTESITPSLTIA